MVTKEQLLEYEHELKKKYPLDDDGQLVITYHQKNGKPKTVKKPKNFEIVQYIKYIEDMDAFLDFVRSYDRYAYIIHDKDEEQDPHIHAVLAMEQGRYFLDIFKACYCVGIKHNYVSVLKGQLKDGLKYLTHVNAPEKYQYDDSEVVSNFDWVSAKNTDDSDEKNRLDEIIELIGNGVICRYNYNDYVTISEAVKYKRQMDIAFKYVDDKLRREVNASMEVIYIQGVSGSGKTTLAKHLADNKRMTTFISATGDDFMDGYEGQECIILDDLRPSCIALADLLKMLDNHTNTTVRSRYYNKVMTKCKLIIITTVLDINTFFNNVFNSETEPINQFKRRCRTKIIVSGDSCIVSSYDTLTQDYGFQVTIENPVSKIVRSAVLTKKEHYEHMANLLGVDLESIERGAEKEELEGFVPIQMDFEDVFPHGE